MSKDQLQEIFEANPKADEIHLVGDMPFLSHQHAKNYAEDTKAEGGVKTVRRESVVSDDAAKKAEKEATDAAKKAEKEAADAAKKAEKEAADAAKKSKK